MKYFLSIVTATVLIGCAHVISEELRAQVGTQPAPEAVFKDPDRYKGKTVILGGMIVSSKNTDEGTYVEVLQKPLDARGRPKYTDTTYGRFIILHEGYLDTAVYSMGREMTLAGEIRGKLVRPLGDVDYDYLFLKSRELYLFPPHRGFPIRFAIGIWKTF